MSNTPPPSPPTSAVQSDATKRLYRSGDRHEIAVEGRYRTGSGVPKDVSILDISESGCRFRDHYGKLDNGTQITIRIGPIGPILATVRWSANRIVGVQFAEPLYGPVFEHIRNKLDQSPKS